jgi:hypothetical protein
MSMNIRNYYLLRNNRPRLDCFTALAMQKRVETRIALFRIHPVEKAPKGSFNSYSLLLQRLNGFESLKLQY